MKKIFIGTAAVVAILGLSACGNVSSDGSVDTSSGSVAGTVKRVDVGGVPCIIYDADGGGGSITCDWTAVQTTP